MPDTLPPTPLFHYSSLAGLKEILDNQSLWLTSLDQQTDLNTALLFIKSVITTNYPGVSLDLFTMDRINQLPVYSFSLTTKKDLPSQWQKYNPQNAYSYSFDSGQLSALANNTGLALLKCIYDDREKADFTTNSIVKISPDDYAQSVQQDDPTCPLDPRHPMFIKQIKLINRNILNSIGTLKDAALQQEQEYRIAATYTWSEILGGPGDTDPEPLPLEVKSAVSNGVSFNYLEAPLITGVFTAVNISEVVIGPSADINQSKLDCENVLAEQCNPNVVISESSVPFAS
ncbi:MAG TPA: hypothetical protein VGN20_09165 [Mucilaginibacter sp.]|jgi:hypothetical protein